MFKALIGTELSHSYDVANESGICVGQYLTIIGRLGFVLE